MSFLFAPWQTASRLIGIKGYEYQVASHSSRSQAGSCTQDNRRLVPPYLQSDGRPVCHGLGGGRWRYGCNRRREPAATQFLSSGHICAMKLNIATAMLIVYFALMSNGCASLRPSANLPESQQASYDYKNQTDSASLQNEDAWWDLITLPLRIALGP